MREPLCPGVCELLWPGGSRRTNPELSKHGAQILELSTDGVQRGGKLGTDPARPSRQLRFFIEKNLSFKVLVLKTPI